MGTFWVLCGERGHLALPVVYMGHPVGRIGTEMLGPPWADNSAQAPGAVCRGLCRHRGPAAPREHRAGHGGVQAQSRQPHFPSVSCGAAFQPPWSCPRSFSAQYGPSASAASHVPSLCMLSHSLVPRVPQDTVPSSEGSWSLVAQDLTVRVCSPAATLRGSRARELISSSLLPLLKSELWRLLTWESGRSSPCPNGSLLL